MNETELPDLEPRQRHARPHERTTEELLRSAARALSSARRESMFEDLSAAVVDLLEVDGAMIGLLNSGCTEPCIDTVAHAVRGGFMPPSRYTLCGTPCETVVGHAFEFYPSGLAELFPHSDAREYGIEGYAAYPLFGSDEAPLGLLAVFSRQPLTNPARVESILSIFAMRAASEVERMRAENALRESEEHYRGIFDASLDGIGLFTTDGCIVDVNPAIQRIYGYQREQLIGKHLTEFMPTDQREAITAFFAEVRQAGSAQAGDGVVWRNGSHAHIEPRGVLINFKGEPHVLIIARDMTETKHRQKALLQSEDRLRATVEAALDPIFSTDEQGRILDFNPAAERCFGYARAEVIGKPLSEMLVPPRLRAAHEAHMELYLKPDADGPLGMREEMTAMRADGGEFPVEAAIGMARGAEGKVFVFYVRDITERLRAEKERALLEAQLRQAQKMEALGHLTGGVAHDFNNILTSVLGYVAMAREHVEKRCDDRLERYLERAQRSGERARDLIQQMLTFSRGQRGERRPLRLESVVNEAVSLLGSMVPASISIESTYDADLPDVVADPVHVQQILMNLCINARDAMAGAGRISITARLQREVPTPCSSCLKPVSGVFVELCVGDTGPGIAPGVVERIFEPFFSTKEVGKGSGMGLATVHGIIHEYGGHVIVDSQPGGGTRMRVLFPAAETPLRAVAELTTSPADVAATRRIKGRVVVCDDNGEVADFIEDLLSSWQLDVRVFHDAAAALKYCETQPALDLVIVDQTMPVITGLELAQLLRRRRPTLPIVLYTGYSETVCEEVVRKAGINALVRKPLEINAFRALVERLLEADR